MPTQNVNLPQALADFVKEKVKGGRFNNASEVVRAGLRLLEQREAEDAAKLQALREAVQLGIDQVERGEYVTVPPGGVDGYMDSVKARVRRKQTA